MDILRQGQGYFKKDRDIIRKRLTEIGTGIGWIWDGYL